MPILIEPYRAEHEPAVQEFNQRLKAAGADQDFVFFRYFEPRWLPRSQSENLYQEYFVAVENGIVRGGYALKWQNFSFADGSSRQVGYYHHPLSEGIVNKNYAVIGAALLKDAMNRAPLLYCLGMGGYDRPLPKMLMRLGWVHCAVPFYFKVVRPYRFLRQIQVLRNSFPRRLLMDFAAVTGAGWAGAKVFQAARRISAPRVSPFTVERSDEFSDWVDSLWERHRANYAITAVRDSSTLRLLYPANDTHLTRLRIRRNGEDIGWAVVGERRHDEKYGFMRVGSIVDCWTAPENALPVMRAASQALKESGMDLIVSNQSHQEWGRALEDCGFLKAESNFIFAASKKLAALLDPFEQSQFRMHFNRADGDGLPRNF
jgi:hypothetical protein